MFGRFERQEVLSFDLDFQYNEVLDDFIACIN